jgi:hypothetical protein
MAKWLAAAVPEWLSLLVLAVFLPALMLVIERRVHRSVPHWRSGTHNDATGIMLSIAAVVYSVAMGLCVVTLWDKRDEAIVVTEAEASNLAAMATGSAVCEPGVRAAVVGDVVAYQRAVLHTWPRRIEGHSSPEVTSALDRLTATVAQLRPRTDAERAFTLDAVQRLTRATELRDRAIREGRDQKLPDTLWVPVLTGSAVVLGLSLTCGIRDDALRVVLISGVAVTVGVNLFLAIELNYPFRGSIRVGPDSYLNVLSDLENTGRPVNR